ncbi:MAG: trypsin-like peptidase domain-containing protein [Streptosporangiales bacterium]
MSEERAAGQATAGREPGPAGSGEAVRPAPGRPPRGWRTYLVVCALALVAGLAGTTAVRMLARPGGGPASAIPSPPAANPAFVADDNGTGADNQANILRYTVPGLVHVLAGRGAGSQAGVVLTPSGIVLTSGQGLRRDAPLVVRTVLSGRTFTARVIGTDTARDLALLQIEGGATFQAVAVGNSQKFAAGSALTAVGTRGLARTFTLDVGLLARRDVTAVISGRRLAGLFESTTRVLAGEETGGPLVNLSGQVIGVDLAGAGTGLKSTGYAVPINEALAAARQMQASGSAK